MTMTSEAEAEQGSVLHAGERAVRAQAGVPESAEALSRRMIHSSINEAQRSLLERVPLGVVGSLDKRGQPWASVLVHDAAQGPPPATLFTASSPHTLQVHARLAPWNPCSQTLQPGAPVGLLGIEPQTRRRARVNGRIAAVTEHGFQVRVQQAYGNCPQHITRRTPERTRPREGQTAMAVQIEPEARSGPAACIREADTCFIASASSPRPDPSDPREGVDVSHRGGMPGFVQLGRIGPQTLLWLPDYAGNNLFNTLGNLLRHPRAGLTFVDFNTGDMLMLTCTAEIVWGGPELARLGNAPRALRLGVVNALWAPAALPFRWQLSGQASG